jgi:hypothetical protein
VPVLVIGIVIAIASVALKDTQGGARATARVVVADRKGARVQTP